MKKIQSLFQRNYEGDRLVRDEVVPGSEWVLAGEGVATQKFDGTSCMVREGRLYKRFDCRDLQNPRPDFIPAQEPDKTTGHWPGWVPVNPSDPADRYHVEAWERAGGQLPDGTYELVGPKVQGGVEAWATEHVLVPHGGKVLEDVPRDFEGLRAYLLATPHMEGIVWHHPDGRMVKLKRKDFTGTVRGVKRSR